MAFYLSLAISHTKENYQVPLVSHLNRFYEFTKHIIFKFCEYGNDSKLRAMVSKGKIKIKTGLGL